MKKLLYTLLILVCATLPHGALHAQTPDKSASTVAAVEKEKDSFDYIPKFHGVLRGWWQLETTDGYSHFLVRNARVSVEGMAAPIVKYYLNVDLCDKGKFLFLDGYASVFPVRNFEIRAGQFRMPFGYESFRGPGSYYFSNRSFIGKYVNNYRAVGAMAGYKFKKVPVTVEAGAFNPTVLDDQARWVKKYAYAGRVLYRPAGWLFATGFESLRPDNIRINLASATVGWECANFIVEGEYMARWYTHDAHKTTHSYNIFTSYGVPLRKSVFDTWSVQARFDGMTDLASGSVHDPETNGRLATTEAGRKRLTVGSTIDYSYKKLYTAFRLNYEKYWYDNDVKASRGNGDVLTAEIIVKF